MDIPPDDGFKWFGEGFSGFPKRLPDDTIEYTIHIINSKLSDSQTRSELNNILQASNEQSKKLLKDYIWQREAFKLGLKRENDRWFLYGRTGFGDSIADEWLIVYLLRELSVKFPQAWFRLCDTDGEFLLIEAANALPKWLNPEIADNRVWMNRGQLRIIPVENGDGSSRNLTLKDALGKIASNTSSLVHSPLVEEEAFYRLRKYPEAIQNNLHNAIVTIPRKLAYLLHAKQAYTSPAVEAFYLRDPISLQLLQKPDTSGLQFPPDDFVTVSARFNKASFAQLKSQEFDVPKAWENAPFADSTDLKDLSRRRVGMKFACGFEMLVQDPQNKDKQAVREIKLLIEDLESGEDALPTDEEIASWPQTEDSESWMDIDFEDFERELSGKKGDGPATAGKGFGDKSAQENLQRMVQQFEKFLNDDTAGPDGAELDDMDFDDDDQDDDELLDDDDDSDAEEDRAVSFDENEFKRMMREMMGMPPENSVPPKAATAGTAKDVENVEEIDSEDEEIRLLSERMEAELNASGALDLNPTPNKMKAVTGGNPAVRDKPVDKGKGKAKAKADSGTDSVEDDGSDEDEDDVNVQIDYNLAKNMLEAFKGQTGMAGPAGNMMGMMGIQMPRDEKDRKESQ